MQSLRNHHNPDELKETNVMWYPGWDPGTEQDIRQKRRKFE